MGLEDSARGRVVNIKAEREAAAISQAELARRIGMHQPKLSRIENGHIEATQGEIVLIRAALHEAAILSNPEVTAAVEAAMPDLEAWEAETPHCQSYPAAPKDVTKRRAWMSQRNRNMQEQGVPAPASGTYGAQPKKPKA